MNVNVAQTFSHKAMIFDKLHDLFMFSYERGRKRL